MITANPVEARRAQAFQKGSLVIPADVILADDIEVLFRPLTLLTPSQTELKTVLMTCLKRVKAMSAPGETLLPAVKDQLVVFSKVSKSWNLTNAKDLLDARIWAGRMALSLSTTYARTEKMKLNNQRAEALSTRCVWFKRLGPAL